MMPGHVVTPEPLRGNWLYPPRNSNTPLIDKEVGGVGYQDPSQGLAVKTWTLEYRDGAMHLSADGTADIVLFSRPGVVEVALAFDINMRAVVGFTDAGGTTFWYYNTLTNQMDFFPYLPAGSTSLRATLDSRDPLTSSTADVLLSYVRNNNLYSREQRDRYEVEYLLATNAGTKVLNMGLSTVNRMQFRLRK